MGGDVGSMGDSVLGAGLLRSEVGTLWSTVDRVRSVRRTDLRVTTFAGSKTLVMLHVRKQVAVCALRAWCTVFSMHVASSIHRILVASKLQNREEGVSDIPQA